MACPDFSVVTVSLHLLLPRSVPQPHTSSAPYAKSRGAASAEPKVRSYLALIWKDHFSLLGIKVLTLNTVCMPLR